MAEQEENTIESETLQPEFPLSKVKRLIKLDREINKINSDALHLITCSSQLFLHFLAERSAEIAISKKRRTIKLEHLRAAVKNHQPTNDFLLDSLPSPPPPPPPDRDGADHRRIRAVEKQVPEGTRRIEDFFRRPVAVGETEDPNG
ncbi:Transcription factor CBF/NF-Y/archaeal histone domain [Dillenia turbinata]|uniref:Transcription factor CBF/NF-Y/archaeal histone domain n=1 Tax=Dillenia turbinata TaxID=194707 RepID=A0AAN8UW50_9MAGN